MLNMHLHLLNLMIRDSLRFHLQISLHSLMITIHAHHILKYHGLHHRDRDRRGRKARCGLEHRGHVQWHDGYPELYRAVCAVGRGRQADKGLFRLQIDAEAVN